jgi:hypothetical protein
MRLQDKGVPCTDSCQFCETNYENDWHVFLGCEEAKNVWRMAGLWEKVQGTMNAATDLRIAFFF